MFKTIRKYIVSLTDSQYIEMPQNAEILNLDIQNENLCLWVLVDHSEKKEKRLFEVFGTGSDIYYDMGIERKYIDTFMANNDSLVFHLFERLN